MLEVRRSEERGQLDRESVKSKHTFSFSEYLDEGHMEFGSLRVIKEDLLAGGAGYPTHSHHNMEILSCVLEGAVVVEDSFGKKSMLRPGELYRLSAGSGVRHSEFNLNSDRPARILQFWIRPNQIGIRPSDEHRCFVDHLKSGDLVLVASETGASNSLKINQDARIYMCRAQGLGFHKFTDRIHRRIWVQVIRGCLNFSGTTLSAGDGAGVLGKDEVHMSWATGSEFVVIDLENRTLL